MKYVIWGMGQNGLELYSMMPRESVCAIIDRDKDNYFVKKNHLTIISFDEYLAARDSMPEHEVIITPFKYRQMERTLLCAGVTKYSILKKSGIGMLAYASLFDGSYGDRLGLKKNESYRVFRKGLYPELLYRQMEQDGYRIEWAAEASDQSDCLSEEHVNHVYYDPYTGKVSEMRNILDGERVFIIGCGPSLTAGDLDALHENKCISMGVNDIYHIFPNTKWRPDFYFASDRRQLIKYTEDGEMKRAVDPIRKIFSDNYIPLMQQERDNRTVCFFQQIQEFDGMGFSTDCSKGVFCSNTVVFGAMQFAVFMGAKTIYLLGCDNGIAANKKLFFYEDKELNDNYEEWEKIALEAYADMEVGYKVARNAAEKIGVKIFNATRGGFLEVFDRVDFDSLFQLRG